MNTQRQVSQAAPIETLDEAVELCSHLQEVAARMSDLMEQETDLLKSSRAREVMALQRDKLELTRTFLQHFTAFRENSAFIKSNVPDHADKLGQAFRNFGKVIDTNLSAVEGAKAVSQGLVDVIHSVAQRANGGPTCYGQDATVGQAKSDQPSAIALDRSL